MIYDADSLMSFLVPIGEIASYSIISDYQDIILDIMSVGVFGLIWVKLGEIRFYTLVERISILEQVAGTSHGNQTNDSHHREYIVSLDMAGSNSQSYDYK
jgi:hypothetical protein